MAYNLYRIERKMAGFGREKGNKKKKATARQNNQIKGESLYRRAISHHAKGDLINAEKEYREAIQTGFYHAAIFNNLGVICKNTGRKDEAILLYEKAMKINPNYPDSYSNLGNLLSEAGALEKALTFTLKSIELKPDNPNSYMNLGGIYKDLEA